MAKQKLDLRTGENDRQSLMVFGTDLRKDVPGFESEKFVKETPEAGDGLPDRGWLPMLLKLKEEEILPDVILSEELRIRVEVALQEPQLAVVGVTGAPAIVTQGEQLGIPLHGRIGVVVGQRFGQNLMPKRTVRMGGPRSCGLRGRGMFSIVHSRPSY